MKLAVIGLGQISRKAYLPALSERSDVELYFMTRDPHKLAQVSDQYRVKHRTNSLEQIIDTGVDAAIVNVSTEAHYEVVTQLIQARIPVLVDKPLDTDFMKCERLATDALEAGVQLMVGFNRRYAPAYQTLYRSCRPNFVLMQKNRGNAPGNIRDVIYDDFIHVVDTVRWFLDEPIRSLQINCGTDNDNLYHVEVWMQGDQRGGVCIMDRVGGINEETLELFTGGTKWRVEQVRDVVRLYNTRELLPSERWSATYKERGFSEMIEFFLSSVRHNVRLDACDALESHRICEEIVNRIENR